LLSRPGAKPDTTHDLAVYDNRKAATDYAEATTVRDVNAKCWLAWLTKLAIDVRSVSSCGSRESFVDGNRDAAHFPTIHAIEGDEVSRFVCDGDTHGNADCTSLVGSGFQQEVRIFVGKAVDCYHGVTLFS
jgi:hypothetical protein